MLKTTTNKETYRKQRTNLKQTKNPTNITTGGVLFSIKRKNVSLISPTHR
jgi:hypothetical protein